MWGSLNQVVQDEHVGTAASAVQPSEARHRCPQKTHTSATSRTKQDYASRRNQTGCSCPEGKSLPLAKAYPAPGRESMPFNLGSQPVDQPRLTPVEWFIRYPPEYLAVRTRATKH